MKSSIMLVEDFFPQLGQNTKFYQQDKNTFSILITDTATGVNTSIHGITKQDYKRLVKIYTRLNRKIANWGKPAGRIFSKIKK